jgi:hypothetical protein
MKPENYTDPLLRDIVYSNKPSAVAMRKLRADDPIRQQADNAKRTKLRRAKRVLTVRQNAWRKAHLTTGKIDRVRHHLSRGRDAGSIAVREGWLVSDVNKLIEETTRTP